MAWESLSVLNGGVIASQTDPNLWGRRIAKTSRRGLRGQPERRRHRGLY
jgi:hypothetical protein